MVASLSVVNLERAGFTWSDINHLQKLVVGSHAAILDRQGRVPSAALTRRALLKPRFAIGLRTSLRSTAGPGAVLLVTGLPTQGS